MKARGVILSPGHLSIPERLAKNLFSFFPTYENKLLGYHFST